MEKLQYLNLDLDLDRKFSNIYNTNFIHKFLDIVLDLVKLESQKLPKACKIIYLFLYFNSMTFSLKMKIFETKINKRKGFVEENLKILKK